MSDDYQHLQPSARVWADEDAVARVRRIRTDRWIAYARAEAALAAIEDVLSFPKRTRATASSSAHTRAEGCRC